MKSVSCLQAIKAIPQISFCLAFLLLSTINAKPNTEVSPKCFGEVLKGAQITNHVDCDQDGYASQLNLSVEMYDAEPIASAYIEIWFEAPGCERKLANTSHFDLPQTNLEIQVSGFSTVKGHLVLKLINLDDYQVADEFTLDETVMLEAVEKDAHMNLTSWRWEPSADVDADGDTYFSYRTLELNFGSCPAEREVYFKLSVCKKPVHYEPCYYYISPEFTVDPSGTRQTVRFGMQESGLVRGTYEVKLILYDAESGRNLTDYMLLSENEKFELPGEDLAPLEEFIIRDVRTGPGSVDRDQDKYYQSIELLFEADVDEGEHQIRGSVLARPADDSESGYVKYADIERFTISPGGMIKSVHIGSIPGGIYDLRIDLYKGTTLVCQAIAENFPALNHLKFESPVADSPIKIDSAYTVKLYDWDRDGLPSGKRVRVDMQNFETAIPAYLLATEMVGTVRTTLDSTPVFNLETGNISQHLDLIPQHPGAAPKILIALLHAHSGDMIAEIRLQEELLMESQYEDIRIDIGSVTYSEIVDLDDDGFYSNARMRINYDSRPIPSEVIVQYSVCPYPLPAEPCGYGPTATILADSTGNDTLTLILGEPNSILPHGVYQIQARLLNPQSGAIILPWSVLDSLGRFEKLAEDTTVLHFEELLGQRKLVDKDGDEYYSRTKLFYSIRSDENTQGLQGQMFLRKGNNVAYQIYFTTDLIDLKKGIAQTILFETAGANPELESGTYDIMIRIAQPVEDLVLMSAGPEDFDIFRAIQLEKRQDDRERPGGQTGQQQSFSAAAGVGSINEPGIAFQVYPNPVTSELIFHYSGSHEKRVVLELLNITGNPIAVIYDGTLENAPLGVDLQDLNVGIYFIRLSCDHEFSMVTILKQ